jgi:aspartate racemase
MFLINGVMKKNKIIFGIIGGAGVASTNLLLKNIEEYFTKNGYDKDFQHPEMIVFQATKSPSRSLFLEKRGPSFIPSYVEIANKLNSIGANIFAMNCNTAHFAIEEIINKTGLSFINLINEVKKEVDNYNVKNIGLIVSDGCRMGNVYEKIFTDYNIVYPDIQNQIIVTRGIKNIKNKNRFLENQDEKSPYFMFSNVCDHLVQKNAELIILGCTDISVKFSPTFYKNIKIIDSLEVLTNVIIKTHLKNEDE